MKSTEPVRGLTSSFLLQHAPVACLITDMCGVILWSNCAARDMFGVVYRDMAGKPMSVFVPLDEQAKLFALLSDLTNARDAVPVERLLTMRTRQKPSLVVACSVLRFSAADNHFVGLWFLRDATEDAASSERMTMLREQLRELQRDHENLRREAEANLQSKAIFVANLVHEVRTPLQAAIGAAELLQMTNPSPEQKELIQSISVAARQLRDVTDAVLAFTRIELGQPKLKISDFDLFQLIDDVMGQFRTECEAKGLYMKKSLAEGVPTHVQGDHVRLRQILLNLLSNAVKFTTDGGITVDVTPFRKSDELLFAVADTGIGMTEDVIQNLFEPFTSTVRPASRSHGGTALGLYICKTLVESMGGRIAADSSIGVGSRIMFTVSLPAVAAQPQKAEGERTEESDLARKLLGLKVLIAEDSDLTARVVTMQLRSLGCQVERVANGAQAVEAINTGGFDLILMDCHMPQLDGFGATRAIRALADKSKAHVPIVALTASAGEDDLERCLAAGMDEFLAKPVGIADLRERILQVVSLRRTA